MTRSLKPREAKKGQGAMPLAGFRGPEPATPSGRNRQAERRKSQGAALAPRLCEFPGLAPLSGVWGSRPNVPQILLIQPFSANPHFAVVAEGGLRRRMRKAASGAPNCGLCKERCQRKLRTILCFAAGIILFSNRTGLSDNRPSGFASLPDCFFLLSLRDTGTMGDFSPGNSHSRVASAAPCDFRRSACLHPAPRAAGSSPPNP